MPVTITGPDQQPPGRATVYDERSAERGVERRTVSQRPERDPREEKVTTATLTGGSTLELIGGGAAVVLAILGLTGFSPMYMTAIATIAIGGGLLAHGAAAAARGREAFRRAAERREERVELAGGLGSEVFGGAGAIALGILALAGVLPMVLLAVAALVVGGAILLGAPAQTDIARMVPGEGGKFNHYTYEAVEGASGAMVFAGIGAIVLGILALIKVGPPLTLVLIAMLAVGGAMFLGGSALTARFGRHLQHA